MLHRAGAGPDRHPLETSLPGVFAIGDVRCGSIKRVAAAVGEGAQVVAAAARLSGADALRDAAPADWRARDGRQQPAPTAPGCAA